MSPIVQEFRMPHIIARNQLGVRIKQIENAEITQIKVVLLKLYQRRASKPLLTMGCTNPILNNVNISLSNSTLYPNIIGSFSGLVNKNFASY
jgi:hypothetical protein